MEPPGRDDGLPMPRFVVIGAQKAGTHWVRDNLNAHPDVFLPPQELHFFTRPGLVASVGLEGYRRLFAGWRGEAVVGEATPGYLLWPHDPAAIARSIDEVVPDVRLVAVLRDPVDRARSALAHLRRTNAVDRDEENLLAALERRPPPEEDPLGVVAGGWYGASLRPFVERFGDRLLVLLNADLASRPDESYEQLLTHIGAEPTFRPPGLQERRFSFDSSRFGLLPPSPAERALVFEYFRDDVDALEVLIGRDLSSWRPDKAGRPAGRGGARLLDLGAGDGNSLVDAEARFGTSGMGVELDPRRVERARRRGLTVHQGDIRTLDPDAYPDVEFVTLDNVLEHMPTEADVSTVLGLAGRIASRLVWIRHPSFEDVDYLADLGLKLYWTDWPSSHTAPVRLHTLVSMAADHGLYDVAIRPVTRIWDSTHPAVLPSSAPPEQTRPDPAVASVYREELHGPKPAIRFDRPVYTAFEILVSTDGSGVAGFEPGAAARDVAGHAPRGWKQQLDVSASSAPTVSSWSNGKPVVVEAGMVRVIAAPMVARALEHRFGVTPMANVELAQMPAGPPVVLIKMPGETSFVVVGGRRIPVPGAGIAVHTDDAWYAELEVDPPLDVLRAAAELQDERRQRAAGDARPQARRRGRRRRQS